MTSSSVPWITSTGDVTLEILSMLWREREGGEGEKKQERKKKKRGNMSEIGKLKKKNPHTRKKKGKRRLS